MDGIYMTVSDLNVCKSVFNSGTHVFIIDNSTGVIRLAYEVLVDQAIYIFQAIATDSNEEVQLSSETTVTVNKQTVNKQTGNGNLYCENTDLIK